MVKAKTNYWVDVIMGIAFLIAFITGIFKWPGLVGYFKETLNLNMYLTSRLHDWSGLVMSLMVFIHLALHWSWIKAMTKQIFTKK